MTAEASPEHTPAPAPVATPAQAPAAPKPDYFEQLLRLKAEFENYRKRVDREKPELFRLAKADLLLKLLPIYDTLRLAHEHLQASQAKTEAAQGLEAIFKEFEKLFTAEGVALMKPLGQPYDPLQHEVLGAIAKEGVKDGEVVEVLQPGFTLHGKVVRTAKVRIAKGGV